ncbi:DoxX family protein [Mycobacterium sp. 2YAF39]|uniref:DoxX family protein n=1 Tax=Mycobacterium sp. 2YAF39 TaxID=3233033 RepID=UPI003F9E91F1
MAMATVIVSILLAALFLFAASIKLLGVRQSLAIRDHLRISPALWRSIGLLELAGVVGVLAGLKWPPLGIVAAAGLALLSLGAIMSHVRSSDSVGDTASSVIGLGLAVATVVLHTR